MDNETVTQDYYSDETVKFGDHLAAACDLVLPAQKKLVQCLGVKFRTLSNEEEDLSETRANWFSILSGIVWASIWQLLKLEGQRLLCLTETRLLQKKHCNAYETLRNVDANEQFN